MGRVMRLPPPGVLEMLLAAYEEAAIEYGQTEVLSVSDEDYQKALAALEQARKAVRQVLELPDG